MDLTKAHADFTDRLTIDGGARFNGQISGWKNELGGLEYPARLLKVSARSPAQPGLVVFARDGLAYLLAEHMGAFFASTQIYRSLRMIRVDQRLSWSRQGQAIDPVTRLPKGDSVIALGTVWCNVDPSALERRSKMKPESRVLIATGADLREGDRVGPYSVTFADKVLGITVAEAQ